MNYIQRGATTIAMLLGATGPVATIHGQGIQFCPGDGTWFGCPCGNTNDGGMSGCDWQSSSGLAGATLSATGSNNLTTNDTILTATNVSGNFGIFFGADDQVTGQLDDGLRCAGGGVVRLIRPTNTGTSSHVLPVSLQSLDTGASIGTTRHYQYWFRTPGGPCGHSANTTNGYSVTWGLGGPHDEMVLVPAGMFEMGRHVGTGGSSELPIHTVSLDAFYVDAFETTNLEYTIYLNKAYAQGLITVVAGIVHQVGGNGQRLCHTTGSATYSRITWDGSMFGVTSGKLNHPMVGVSWYGTCTYANQRSLDHGLTPSYDEITWDCDFSANGYRLPTEAEWEYASRGGEHNPYYKYPWGNVIDGAKANYWNSGDPYETGTWPRTTPVGYYDGNQSPAGVDMANGYGLYDTAGNVWEWCGDWYNANYYNTSPSSNPTGPATGTTRLLRGGGWHGDPVYQRTAFRGSYPPSTFDYDCGFRLVLAYP